MDENYKNDKLWIEFLEYLKNLNSKPICEWISHQKLIMKDDRAKRTTFLKEIKKHNYNVIFYLNVY